jgi:hypothetical protein
MSTAFLEQGKTHIPILALLKQVVSLEQQHDELLAAGNRVITRFDARLDEERESILHAIDALREAIAKAQGDV